MAKTVTMAKVDAELAKPSSEDAPSAEQVGRLRQWVKWVASLLERPTGDMWGDY